VTREVSPELRVPLQEALAALTHYGAQMSAPSPSKGCDILEYGSGWGAHALCELQHVRVDSDLALTYGISRDYSFESQIGKMGIRVLGMDPSVSYPNDLDHNLYFWKVGAPGPYQPSSWSFVPPAQLYAAISMVNDIPLKLLKMDCEGCEYYLYESTLQYKPDFWAHVEQFAVEIHVTKKFMPVGIDGEGDGLGLAYLFALLRREHFRIQDVKLTSCAPDDEALGCSQTLVAHGWPCAQGQMCQNILFSKQSLSSAPGTTKEQTSAPGAT
jgi:hypothetical protein